MRDYSYSTEKGSSFALELSPASNSASQTPAEVLHRRRGYVQMVSPAQCHTVWRPLVVGRKEGAI